MKTKSNTAPAAPQSLADVEALIKQSNDLRAQAEAARDQIKVQTAAKITTEVTDLRVRIAKHLGVPEFSLGELLPVVSALNKGIPLFAEQAKNGSTGALTPEKSQQIKDAMFKRAAALRAGTPAESISAICDRIGTTAATCSSRKPTKAEYEAMPGNQDVEHAYQAAA